MGGLPLNCPLCCNNTFNSKQSLLDHLTNASENVYCPVCNYKCSSLPHLVEHLARDNCQPANNVHSIIFERQSDQENIKNTSVIGNSEIKVYQNEIHTTDGTRYTTEHSYETQVDPNDTNKMYVELFSKDLKPCLQTREFKLVKENGESRYMIVTQDNTDLTAGNTIVTKQNVDGTISLTTVKDMNMESENLITPDNTQETQEETQADSQEEIYSCNTCKVSFSSVIDHIQTYHSDQEVVVEEPAGDGQTQTVLPVEYEAMESEDTLMASDKQAPRRVITDTGDIVEEPLMYKSEDQQLSPEPMCMNQTQETSKPDEPKLRVVTQRLLQMNKLCDSVIKNAIQAGSKDKTGPYHKVVVKEVQTENGFAIKMYQCLACDISVTNLDEFKIHPCKKLKYPCLYCPVAYDNSKSLCAHMKAHKVRTDPILTGPITYECSVCCTVFPTNKSLKLHKRMHDPVKSRPIEPPVENTDGSEVSEGRYHCTFCNKMIPNDYKTIHQNSHKTSEKMNCAICNKKFTSIEYLEMHTNVHNVDKAPLNNQDKNLPYSCLFCNRRFARPHEKVKHERIHTGEKPHSCEICGKSFRVSYCLTLHMRTHTGARPYACPHCGKRFKAHSVYNHHLLTHSEVRAYKCPFCPKAFKTSVQLAGHKNSHTKPFACQHCNRPFASLYAVRVHTETHARQNNLKFSCELCGASYARAFALKDHIKQAHSDVQEQSAQSPTQPIDGEDDWMIKANEDADGIQALNKDLSHEMDLGMSANELIVP